MFIKDMIELWLAFSLMNTMKYNIMSMQDMYLIPRPAGEFFIMIFMTDNLQFIFQDNILCSTKKEKQKKPFKNQRTRLLGLSKPCNPISPRYSLSSIPRALDMECFNVHLKKKENRGTLIGRLYLANPNEGEFCFLWLSLHHSPGCKSFQDSLTLEDGTVCTTYKEIALERGFLQNDEEWIKCLREAA